MAFGDQFGQWYWWLIMVISILFLTLVLYFSVRLICGRKKFDGGYFLRLFLVSFLLIVVVEVVAQAISSLIDLLILSTLFYVLLTIGFILVIRYLITVPAVVPYAGSDDKYWQWSIWITVISLIFILAIAYAIYLISNAAGDPIYIFVPG